MASARLLERDCVPPLESGDVLTADEFDYRYQAMADLKKAELIEGVVYLGSPVHVEHSEPHADMVHWLSHYRLKHPGLKVGDNGSVKLDNRNTPQPDIYLRREEGGSARVSESGYIEGAPELVVEISGSSASRDLHHKLPVYQRHGIKEYIVWRVYDAEIDWFVLVEGRYVPLRPDERGIIESPGFPGLRLAVQAMLDANLDAVLAEVR